MERLRRSLEQSGAQAAPVEGAAASAKAPAKKRTRGGVMPSARLELALAIENCIAGS